MKRKKGEKFRTIRGETFVTCKMQMLKGKEKGEIRESICFQTIVFFLEDKRNNRFVCRLTTHSSVITQLCEQRGKKRKKERKKERRKERKIKTRKKERKKEGKKKERKKKSKKDNNTGERMKRIEGKPERKKE